MLDDFSHTAVFLHPHKKQVSISVRALPWPLPLCRQAATAGNRWKLALEGGRGTLGLNLAPTFLFFTSSLFLYSLVISSLYSPFAFFPPFSSHAVEVNRTPTHKLYIQKQMKAHLMYSCTHAFKDYLFQCFVFPYPQSTKWKKKKHPVFKSNGANCVFWQAWRKWSFILCDLWTLFALLSLKCLLDKFSTEGSQRWFSFDLDASLQFFFFFWADFPLFFILFSPTLLLQNTLHDCREGGGRGLKENTKKGEK